MKEHWFRHVERKEREAQYRQTYALCLAGDISNIKDGFKKLKEALNEYHGALFPWIPDPSEVDRKRAAQIIEQLNSELEYLEKEHTFAYSHHGGTMSLVVPKHFLGSKKPETNAG
jgi:hypothetical protein